jgi:PAS domain S-box-containing protein
MAAPQLDTDHPGLRVLAEVVSLLSVDLAPRGGLTRIADALRTGLGLERCRLWVPSDTGHDYALVVGTGDTGEAADGRRVPGWMRAGPHREVRGNAEVLRFPLLHGDTSLGVMEGVVPRGPAARVAHDVLMVVARLLGPMLGAAQLSRDLAFEVAQRTNEVAAQHSFVARIIDSLPVGLYVIDRAYRIRAWNRKREAGTQGVVRDEAVGREIFDVLDRQPRELLKREFDGVFETGEMQQMEMESQSSGDVRYYRITKIPMRIQGDEITHVITIGEDVTEWRQAQQQLAQTDKLAAIGQLAAGVMHEINNPLATILACTESLLLRRDAIAREERTAYEEYLKIIDTEVQRCRHEQMTLRDDGSNTILRVAAAIARGE